MEDKNFQIKKKSIVSENRKRNEFKNKNELLEFFAKNSNLENDDFILFLRFDEYDVDTIKQLEDFCDRAIAKGNKIDVIVDAFDLNFSVSELEMFIDLEEKLEKNKRLIGFYGGIYEEYTLNEVLSAQEKIDKMIDKINKSGGSPFEKYLMAYSMLIVKKYKENESNLANPNNENASKSRDIIAVLNGDDIVCVGYARLMDRICKGIGIESYSQQSSVYDKETRFKGLHQNNIVYLKDEKYGIDGCYYSDACWDSGVSHSLNMLTFNHCLVPLSDKDKLKNDNVTIRDNQKIKEYNLDINELYKNNGYDLYSHVQEIGIHKWRAVKGSSRTETLQDEVLADLTEEDREKYKKSRDNNFLTFISKEKRKKLCQNLSDVFKKMNIPEDIYNNHDEIPKDCDYRYMLALMAEQKIDQQELTKCFRAIRDFAKNSNKKRSEDELDTHMHKCPNIYEKLQGISSVDEELVEMFGTCRRMIEYSNSLSYARLLNKNKVKLKAGKPISLENFKNGLTMCYTGLNSNKWLSRVDEILDYTIETQDDCFNDDATNAFKQEALRRAKEQNQQPASSSQSSGPSM